MSLFPQFPQLGAWQHRLARALVLGISAAITGCHSAKEAPEPAEPKVEGSVLIFPTNSSQLASITVGVATASRPPTLRFPGRVVWDENVTTRVYTPLAGRVVRLLCDLNAEVASNTALALIASPDLGQAQADAHRAETDYALAERTRDREKDLFAHGAAAEKDLLAAEADLARAALEKDRAAVRLRLYGEATNSIDQLYQLKSQTSGVVVERHINPGQEVRADSMLANSDRLSGPLFVVTDPSRVWVLVDITEQDLPNFRTGQAVNVRSRAFEPEVFHGKVELVPSQIETSTRMIRVRASIENPRRLLKAEMLVNVELELPAVAGVEVPAKAIFLTGEAHYLFREENPGHFVRQAVKVGPERGGQILVANGLKVGDRIVTDGCLLLEQIFSSD